MKRTVFLFLLLSFLSAKPSEQGPDAILREAGNTLEPRRSLICEKAAQFGLDPLPVISMVAPEAFRYSRFRDFLETGSLELLYVQLGSRDVDFSIGLFQIKPSFVEQLEEVIRTHPAVFSDLAYITAFPSEKARMIRQERLDRLKDAAWQLDYIFAFYRILSDCFSYDTFSSEAEQTAFFASAYNLGFRAGEGEIRDWMAVRAFPYGRRYEGPQWSYASLARSFFLSPPAWLRCHELSGSE